MTVEEIRDDLNYLIEIGLRDAVVVTQKGVRIMAAERWDGVSCGDRYEFGFNPAGTSRPLVALRTLK